MLTPVAVHADAGAGIGLGHAIRCCGLAQALRRLGFDVVFINTAGDDLHDFLSPQGLNDQICLPSSEAIAQTARRMGAGLLIADSYRLDRAELAKEAAELKLAWFDDTATQAPLADVIINGSPAASALPYVLPTTVLPLLGAKYQVVRPGLSAHPRAIPVQRLLVTYGGSDPKAVGPVLASCLPRDLAVDFVVGPFAPVPANLPDGINLHHNPATMADLINRADLAISAGGQTLFELAAARVPTLAIGIGDDQRPNLHWLERHGALIFAGWADDPALALSVRRHLAALRNDDDRRHALATTAHSLIDGHGADRIALALKQLLT